MDSQVGNSSNNKRKRTKTARFVLSFWLHFLMISQQYVTTPLIGHAYVAASLIYLEPAGKERRALECEDHLYVYDSMYEELEKLEEYERRGICLLMDNDNITPIAVSPIQVMKLLMVKDGQSNYMRDYELDEKGNLVKLTFTNRACGRKVGLCNA